MGLLGVLWCGALEILGGADVWRWFLWRGWRGVYVARELAVLGKLLVMWMGVGKMIGDVCSKVCLFQYLCTSYVHVGSL